MKKTFEEPRIEISEIDSEILTQETYATSGDVVN